MVLDANNNVIIDNAAHKEALDFYTSLVKSAPSGAAQVDWAAAQNLFNQGKTAMTRFWAHAYRQIPKDAPVYGKVGAAAMIGGTAGVAGVPGPWYLSVPKATKNADNAKKFIKCAYDHNDLGIESTLGLAARISAFEKYQDKPGYESFKPLIADPERRRHGHPPRHREVAADRGHRTGSDAAEGSGRRGHRGAPGRGQEKDPGPDQVRPSRPAPA